MNESHRPIPGKLYRLMGSPLKHLTLNAFKSQNSLYGGGEFKFCPEEAFLLCLPKLKREHIRQPYDFFLVSGTRHSVVLFGLGLRPKEYNLMWLEEVVCDVE